MALQNIGIANKDDAFYRYKMPRLVTKIEGRGNGIKTNLVNVVDVAKALARSPAYITKFYGCELGAQSKFDEKTNTAIVNGAHETVKLSSLLEAFIKKYVQCYGCGNPETEITITKSQAIMLKCAACGFTSNVDMMDKLATFILKNPPLNQKKQRDLRKSEKERRKAGESVDMEMKRTKKNGHNEAKQAPKKKSSSSDEEVASSNNSQMDEVDDVFREKEEIVWLTDTSTKAAQQRIKEQLNTVTSELVTLTVNENQENLQSDSEIYKAEPTAVSPCLNGKIFKNLKHCIDNGLSADEVVAHLKIGHQGVQPQEVMIAFFEALFHGVETGLPKEIRRKKNYLLNAITDVHHQTLLLGAIEAHYSTKAHIICKEIALSLKMLYDLDILEEEVIVAWYDRNTNDDVKKFAKPFVDWVQNAELEE